MRTTLNINDQLYKLVKMQVASSGATVTDFVEDALTSQLLEDGVDADIDFDKIEKEPRISHKDLLKQLKSEGLI